MSADTAHRIIVLTLVAVLRKEALAAVQLHTHELAGAGEAPDPPVSEAVRALMPWRTADVGALHRMLRFQGFLRARPAGDRPGPRVDGRRAPAARRARRLRGPVAPHARVRPAHRAVSAPRVFLAETHQACACGHDHSASFAPVLRAETERGGD